MEPSGASGRCLVGFWCMFCLFDCMVSFSSPLDCNDEMLCWKMTCLQGRALQLVRQNHSTDIVFDIHLYISMFTNIARMGEGPTKVAVRLWHYAKPTSTVPAALV
ncbi:unnamed protein product [Symbiodinium sp. CCMP2456]|nr:unnamed protein product [Symbiodinium sp. CCMP2456]